MRVASALEKRLTLPKKLEGLWASKGRKRWRKKE